MDAVRKQAERFGAELVSDDVTEVDLTASPKVVRVGADTFLAKTVIIATGSSYRELGIPARSGFPGTGCPGARPVTAFFFRERDIAVVAAVTRQWRRPPS